jgi:hypothetical protein
MFGAAQYNINFISGGGWTASTAKFHRGEFVAALGEGGKVDLEIGNFDISWTIGSASGPGH